MSLSAVQWPQLLSDKRIGRSDPTKLDESTRSQFDRDFDRIIFSSAFRRLQDKTQVFPLSSNDSTRTRLTHSLEVSCVGRSLGRSAGSYLEKNELINFKTVSGAQFEASDVGAIVASACLAHDLGNPPFGHSGESAIQEWASRWFQSSSKPDHDTLTPQQKQDLLDFEGNAQAIRVITRLQSSRRPGGLQLTLATIGAMMKYPCGSIVPGKTCDTKRVEQKKFGYFDQDSLIVRECLDTLGLTEYEEGAYYRHPLAFLVEAADDICYAIVDLEDSVDQRLITADEANELLLPIAKQARRFEEKHYSGKDRLLWLRAYAIHALVGKCTHAFERRLDEIISGQFSTSLISDCELEEDYNKVRDKVKQTAYLDRRVLTVEAAGFRVIGGLLDIFASALTLPLVKSHQKVLHLISPAYLGLNEESDSMIARLKRLEQMSHYERLLVATDYVSGMTDRFAVDLFQKLSGSEFPE